MRLQKLEAIRGLCTFYVVIGHTFSGRSNLPNLFFSPLLKFGQEAVIAFFFLSGFVIQLTYDSSKDKSFKLYFLKRFLRIYIPIVFVFLVNYITLSYEHNKFIVIDYKSLVGNLLMLQDNSFLKVNVICDPFLNNLPLWSLSYEWWFYMIFILVKKYHPREDSVFVNRLGVLAAISYLFYPNFLNRLLIYLVIWWIGVEIANTYIRKKNVKIESFKQSIMYLIICLSILVINALMNYNKIKNILGINGTLGESPLLEIRHFSFALAALFIVFYWKKHNWLYFQRTVGLFTPLASISFGLYISHWFLVSRAHYLDKLINNTFIRYFFYFIICLIFSYIIEQLIYRRLSQKILSKFRMKAQVSSPIIKVKA